MTWGMPLLRKEPPGSPGSEGANWTVTTAQDIHTKLESPQKVTMLKRICFEKKILRKGKLRF